MQILSAYCTSHLARWCEKNCPHSSTHGPLVALLDASKNGADDLAWRCYAPSTLDAARTRYVSGDTYCTRHEKIKLELARCQQEDVSVELPPQLLRSPRAIAANHPWHSNWPAARILSLRPLVAEVPNFLSAAECDGLIRATAGLHDEKGCLECGTYWFNGREHGRRGQNWLTDETMDLVTSVEERIGELVGMRTHEHENVIKVTSYKPTSSRAAYNLHHEKIGRPNRVATVLVYLSSLIGARHGGETIFPAASPNASVVRSFRAITPPRGTFWRVDERASDSRYGSVGLFSPEATDDVRAAQAAADATCTDLNGASAGVSVEPLRGKALVWYHERPDGVGTSEEEHLRDAEPLAWHCGCRVKEGGGERWALQKFKEHPRGGRAPERFYEVMAAHHEKLAPEQDGVAVQQAVQEECEA